MSTVRFRAYGRVYVGRGLGRNRRKYPTQRWRVDNAHEAQRTRTVWCRDNCEGNWNGGRKDFTFQSIDDATMFTIRFGGKMIDLYEGIAA